MPRIVSLLPSATEIVFALGLGDSLVGVTHECDYPAPALQKPHITRSKLPDGLESAEIDEIVRSQLDQIGSIYELDLEKLEALRPDIVLTQQLCTVCAVSFDYVAEEAAKLSSSPKVVNLEPKTLSEVLESIRTVALLSGTLERATKLINDLEERIFTVRKKVAGLKTPRVQVLEWIDPPFAAGHWIPELVEIAGGENNVAFMHAPSRQVSWERLAEKQPEIIVVAECGFSVERQRIDIRILQEQYREALLNVKSRTGSDGANHFAQASDGAPSMPEIWICDGSQYFSRPGPRLVDTVEMLTGIFHRELRDESLAKFRNGHDFEQAS